LAPHQKKARRTGAEIVFVDETGFAFQAKTATTWAPIGQTPILRRLSTRRELSTAIALTLSGRIFKRHFQQAIGGTEMVVALQHCRRHLPGPMIVIWDRSTTHRALVVKAYLAEHPEIHVAWLPPYAPDLNPEEGCHGNIKQHLRHATPASIHELRAQVDRGFARLRQRPDLILGFFRHAGLSVTQLW
jgi:transposase